VTGSRSLSGAVRTRGAVTFRRSPARPFAHTLAGTLGVAFAALALAAPPLSAQPTQVVMLGTGTPNADPDRSGPAVAVVRNGRSYLIDAGPGIVRRAAAAARAGVEALGPRNLRVLFLTHLHSDHTVGLPDLILSTWVLERPAPLEIYGPPGTRAMVEHLLVAYAEDIRVRLDGAEPANPLGPQVNVHEIVPGQVFSDSNVVVRAFAVPHGDWEVAFGYRFESADRTIVVSGDTRASDAVVAACNGCDLLMHEVYSADRFRFRTPAWQRYHALAHTSTVELAALGTRAAPRLLVLYHQLYWGTDDAGLLAEMRAAGYSGPLMSARDLGIY
jgi:ribonuclease BN (tRNA processing enzyme)